MQDQEAGQGQLWHQDKTQVVHKACLRQRWDSFNRINNRILTLAGIDVTYKNVPTSLQITYTKINVCTKIRQVLGTTLGNKFLKARDPICNCFTKLRTLNGEGKFASSSAGNFDLANTYYLDQAQNLQKVRFPLSLPRLTLDSLNAVQHRWRPHVWTRQGIHAEQTQGKRLGCRPGR